MNCESRMNFFFIYISHLMTTIREKIFCWKVRELCKSLLFQREKERRMDVILRPLFNLLTVPDLKIKRPAWIAMPSPWTIFTFVLLSYFMVTGGIIYDVIVEPPSVGSTTDEHGHTKPVAFMPYRVNGQYIMEGLASSFMFRWENLVILLEMESIITFSISVWAGRG